MPVSRNKKKKNSQNNSRGKAAPTMCIHELFRLQTNPCRKCGGIRDEFSYMELPDKEQPHWKASGILSSVDYFLYCPNCDEYSAILEVDEL